MARIHRRKLLQLSGAGAMAAKTGGIAAILATSRAPAYAQAATVHWLRWNDFVPASDELLKKEIAPEAEKALGIKLNIETINGNDLQARTTSAIQSGVGPRRHLRPQQLAAALCRERRQCRRRRRGDRQGARRLLRGVEGRRQQRPEVARGAVVRARRHDRLSQVLVRRAGRQQLSRRPGRNTARSARS